MYIEKTISEYLDAVARRHGEEVRRGTTIKHCGGSQVVLKAPNESQGQLVSVGRLRLMTEKIMATA